MTGEFFQAVYSQGILVCRVDLAGVTSSPSRLASALTSESESKRSPTTPNWARPAVSAPLSPAAVLTSAKEAVFPGICLVSHLFVLMGKMGNLAGLESLSNRDVGSGIHPRLAKANRERHWTALHGFSGVEDVEWLTAASEPFSREWIPCYGL
ncbi:MAG: hypothetical protein R6U57_08145 [Anaerolineales bacterium]